VWMVIQVSGNFMSFLQDLVPEIIPSHKCHISTELPCKCFSAPAMWCFDYMPHTSDGEVAVRERRTYTRFYKKQKIVHNEEFHILYVFLNTSIIRVIFTKGVVYSTLEINEKFIQNFYSTNFKRTTLEIWSMQDNIKMSYKIRT
jgi:hypothetical protein